MKDGNWIPIDKSIVNLLPRDREYTILEAYISFRIDIENESENSINGYARIWSWSRTKVRNFIKGLKTSRVQARDRQETGKRQAIRLIFNNLEEHKDRQETGKRQARDRQETITNNPNPNNIPYGEIIDDLNRKGGFRYQICDAAKRHINARFSEGYTIEDFFKVHTIKITEWKGTKDAKYIRPETLYGNKFQGYLNQPMPGEESGTPSWW
jgi:uncharacterized phage protein (TIGR02220 family)